MSDAAGDAGLNTQLADVHNEFMTALVSSGLLGKLRAQLRAAAVAILDDDKTVLRALGSQSMKSATDRSKIALLLIEDFLQTKTMKHSLGVFAEESNVGSIHANERDQLLHPLQQKCDSSGSSLLEAIIGLALLPPATAPAAPPPQQQTASSSQQQQRAPSPDIEIAAAQGAPKKETNPSASAGATSTAGSRRGSTSAPAADPLDDSVEYSDRSADSSLDMSNCLAVERLAPKTSGVPAAARGGGESTSDDDF